DGERGNRPPRAGEAGTSDSLSPSEGERAGVRGRLQVSELQRLANLGLLRIKDPPRPRDQYHLVNPYDPSQPLDTRARSWLHVNCSGCHRFNGGGVVPLHLNFDKPPREWRALEEKPTRGDFDLVGARIIAPGDPFRSVLFYRISTEGAGHMPHIGSRLADEAGVTVVRDWIRTLPPSSSDRAVSELNEAIAGWLKQGDFAKLPSTMNGALALAEQFSVAGAGAVRANSAPEGFPTSALAGANALSRDFFQRFLPPERRRSTLGMDINPKVLLALRGDATRGRELFAGVSQCARCHICAGTGRAFGPDLTGIGKKYDRAQLLDHILNPSKFIVPEFKTVSLTLRDGTELSGFVLQRTATELVLRDETLKEHPLKLSDVKEQRESTLSAMPEGLLAPLTAQEAADLLEFLAR
ncbi:MAG TPA: c-type cytochrome, partial [Verrucomicrobiae bacterium]|nr:c-type cytochrome [Verrucomicrobiae bacterium]